MYWHLYRNSLGRLFTIILGVLSFLLLSLCCFFIVNIDLVIHYCYSNGLFITCNKVSEYAAWLFMLSLVHV